jgi:predicted dehydrogenase
MKTKVLLVGTGYWAEQHIKAYAMCRETELAGLVGHADENRLKALMATYGIGRGFMDVGEAIEAVKPEMVDIAGSPQYRLEGVKACAGRCVKVVNLEKPMARTPGEAYAIEALCRETGLLLTVNHQKKFNAPWARAARLLREGVIGDIRFFRATCKGNILEQGTHLVDMLLYFNGYNPIDWLMAQVADPAGFDKVKTAAPDSAMVEVAFRNGVRGYLDIGNNGWEIPGETEKWFKMAVEAYGEKGHLAIQLNRSLEVTTYADGRTWSEPSLWESTYLQGLADHLDAVARYGRHPAEGHMSALDRSMMSFQAVMGIYASVVRSGRVTFPCRLDDRLADDVKGALAARQGLASGG